MATKHNTGHGTHEGGHHSHIEYRGIEIPAEDRDRKITLAWRSNSASEEQVQETRLLNATGFDVHFVAYWQEVREYMEALRLVDGDAGENITYLFNALRKGARRIEVSQDGKVVDLRDVATLLRIKRINWAFPPKGLIPGFSRMDTRTLEDRFWKGDPIAVSAANIGSDGKTKEGVKRNLGYDVLPPSISPDQFRYFLAVIRAKQAYLNAVSLTKDQDIERHHRENGGLVKPYHIDYADGDRHVFQYIPVSISEARGSTIGEIKKRDPNFRAKGHIHEIGEMDEDFGTVNKFHYSLVEAIRGVVNTYAISNGSNERMQKTSLGLSSTESPVVDGGAMYFGGKKEKRTNIYTSLRNYWDATMQLERGGIGIQEVEIGDRLITDVICPRFAGAPIDWFVCFKKISGLGKWSDNTMFTTNLIRSYSDSDEPKFVFSGLHPRGIDSFNRANCSFDVNGDVEASEFTLCGVKAFTAYMQWRIDRGDVDTDGKRVVINWMNAEVQSAGSNADVQSAGGSEVVGDGDDEEVELQNTEALSPRKIDAVADICKTLFGAEAKKFVGILRGDITSPRLNTGLNIMDTPGVIRFLQNKNILHTKSSVCADAGLSVQNEQDFWEGLKGVIIDKLSVGGEYSTFLSKLS